MPTSIPKTQPGISNVSEDTTPQLGGSLDVNGNPIVSTSNGNITLTPDGTGDVVLGNFILDADQTVGAGQNNYVLTYDHSSGKISLEVAADGGSGISDVVEDMTPQLGGNLDLNSYNVGDASAADLTKLSELTATSTELNYVDGVTSNIQTQIDTHTHTASDITDFDTEVSNNATVDANATKLAGIESGATADQTAGEILTAIQTVDGTGSGLDADLLDGQEASAFAAASHSHATTDITSGTFADARIAESNITQHEAALTITESQISDLDRLVDVADDTSPQLGGNLDVNGNEIVSTSNGNIVLNPDGTGDVAIGNFTFDADQTVGVGQDNYVLTYDNSSGKISLEASAGGGGGIDNVVEDTTPELGGNLDTQGNLITNTSGNLYLGASGYIYLGTTSVLSGGNLDVTSYGITSTTGALNLTTTTNNNISLQPDGTGDVLLGNFTFDADQTVGAGQDNYVLTYDNSSGKISLEAAAGGGLADVVDDTTPQLGGNLDLNSYTIGDASSADLTKLSNLTATAAELNYTDGVTSNLQTQLDGKASTSHTHTASDITDFDTEVTNNTTVDANTTKLAGIEAGADVTDTANVTAAGALMDSEVTNLAQVKAFDSANYATAAQGTTADSALQDVVDDTTPQLGGSLDVNGQKIVSVSNGDIDIEPNGTGNVLLGNLTFDADQTVGAGQDNYVLTYDNSSGLISLESAAGGGGLSDVVDDTTPQLGGNLDIQSNEINTSVSNGNIIINANGTGAAHIGYYGSQYGIKTRALYATQDSTFDGDIYCNGTIIIGSSGWDGTTFSNLRTITMDSVNPTTISNIDTISNMNAMRIESESDLYLYSDAYLDIVSAGDGVRLHGVYMRGNINLDGYAIMDYGGNDMQLTAESGYTINLGNMHFVHDQTIGAGQDNYVLTYDHSTGHISLEAAAGGGLADVVDDTSPQLGGNLDVNSNEIVSTSNGNIVLNPDGTGDVVLGNFTFDVDQSVGAGQDNYVLTYDNSTGKLSLEAATGGGGGLANVVDDTTPQLGGDLDVNSNAIVSTSNGDIELNPHGTGRVTINAVPVQAAIGFAG